MQMIIWCILQTLNSRKYSRKPTFIIYTAEICFIQTEECLENLETLSEQIWVFF